MNLWNDGVLGLGCYYIFLWISGRQRFVLVYIREQENAVEIDLD